LYALEGEEGYHRHANLFSGKSNRPILFHLKTIQNGRLVSIIDLVVLEDVPEEVRLGRYASLGYGEVRTQLNAPRLELKGRLFVQQGLQISLPPVLSEVPIFTLLILEEFGLKVGDLQPWKLELFVND
jgi:hypothetical protein